MDRVFKKNFRFSVDNYEEWEDQKCKSQGMLNGEIYAYVSKGLITFKLFGMEDLDIESTIVMDLNSPFTMKLESKDSLLVTEDRIQYFQGFCNSPGVPHICHVFCQYGRVSYVRFAFPDPDKSQILPMTKRIYEFYGDMIELDSLSQESMRKIGVLKSISDESLPEAELYARKAMALINIGNTGDDAYHLLYKSWRSYQENPAQLKDIYNYGSFGTAMSHFLFYGTIEDLNIKQQVASVAYLFISKAIEEGPAETTRYMSRLFVMEYARDAFQYTVSAVVNGDDGFMTMNLFPFKSRDALYMMEYSDLVADRRLCTIDMLQERKLDLENKINNNFFSGKNIFDVVREGNELHKKVLNYLSEKILENEDIDF